MSEYEVTTNNKNKVLDKISMLGYVTENWPDGSFNFKCYDEECEDEFQEILEELKVEFKLL